MAWLLVKNGIHVKMIERQTDFSREFRGEGIQISVVKHLDELGLMEDIRKLEKENIHYSELFDKIQKERIKEIRIMQKFQQKFGYFMLGAPRW